MKYLVFILLLISSIAEGQSRYVIRADSTQLEKVGGNNELILLNGTRARTGAYLKNTGNGRTGFFYAGDSLSIAGSNLTMWRGAGSQNITVALPGGASDVVVKPGILRTVDSIRPEVRYFNSKYSDLYQQNQSTSYQRSLMVKALNFTGGLNPSPRDGAALINVDNVNVMMIGGWGPASSTDSVFVSDDGFVTKTFLWLAPWGADHSVPTFKADDDYWYHIGRDYQGTGTSGKSVWRSATPLVLASWVQMTNAAQFSDRILFDAIGFNNALYNYGGQYTTNWSDGATDTVWRSIDGGANWSYWSTAPDGILDKNISKTSVIFRGRVYFVGGGRYDDGTPANRTFDNTVYSTADFITFRQENSFPTAGVQYPAVGVLNGLIVRFGGFNGTDNTNAIDLMDMDGNWHVAANYDSTRTAIPITHAVGITNWKDGLLFTSGNAFNYSFLYSRSRYITNDSLIHFAPHRINERTTFSEFPVSLTTFLAANLMADPITDSMYRYDNASNGVGIQLDPTNDEVRFIAGVGPNPYDRVAMRTGFVGRYLGSGRWNFSTNSAYNPAGTYRAAFDGNTLADRYEANTAYDIAGSQVLAISGLRVDLGRAGGFSTLTIPNLLQFGALTGAPAWKRVNTTDLQLMDANESDQTSSLGLGIAPHTKLHVDGPIATGYVATAVSLTINAFNSVVNVTATGQTITLPTAVGIAGRQYTIKLTASGSGTVDTTSSQTIDGSTTYSLSAQYKYVTVVSDGANWIVTANN